jgi:glycosyltransferase involved in cell wall biosynthesis
MTLHIIAPTFDPNVVGGAGTVLVELTSRFLRDVPETKIYLNEQTAPRFPEWRDAIVPVRCGSMKTPSSKALAVLLLELFGSVAFPREGVCWFPFGSMMPLWFRGAGVSTIHDTLERDLPGFLPITERLFRSVLLPRTVRMVSVATSSNFSAQHLRKNYGIEPTVIPLGATPMPRPSTTRVPSRPYVFYPANAYPHKNHRFLLEVWRQHPELSSIALVFTLGSGVGRLEKPIEESRRAGIDVIVTGRVTDEEVAGLYQNAICAASPSLYEGFGLLMQEALQCDCPVLANSSWSAMRETVSSDYPYFLPLEPSAWAQAILANPRTTDFNFSRYGIRRTWDECAKDYEDLFQSLAR